MTAEMSNAQRSIAEEKQRPVAAVAEHRVPKERQKLVGSDAKQNRRERIISHLSNPGGLTELGETSACPIRGRMSLKSSPVVSPPANFYGASSTKPKVSKAVRAGNLYREAIGKLAIAKRLRYIRHGPAPENFATMRDKFQLQRPRYVSRLLLRILV
jgi:hypothetical protein